MLKIFILLSIIICISNAQVFPSIPANFSTSLEPLFPLPPDWYRIAQLQVRGGYLSWDYNNVVPIVLLKNSFFSPQNGSDFYMDLNTYKSYMYFNSNSSCIAIDMDDDDFNFWFTLVSFSWLNGASYVGLPMSNNPTWGTNCNSFGLWRSSQFSGNYNTVGITGSIGSVCGRVGMAAYGYGFNGGYNFNYKNLAEDSSPVVVPSACASSHLPRQKFNLMQFFKRN
eukprot:TRINITY_DN14077_c0_g1_i1.p1 TRINITY_DN14077_c0_g1~~TRINITY_DN14077_c0_g1_i1.p1  ORF type:complete len:225 (+),score=66.90 TRINITY_DN14077_c0_g1_i1:12-686(+)